MIYVVLIILSFNNCSSKKPFGSMNTLRRELKANNVNIGGLQNGVFLQVIYILLIILSFGNAVRL